MAGRLLLLFFFLFWFLFDFFSDFRRHQGIYSNLKISSLVTMTCQCRLSSWQSNLVQKMARGYDMNIIYQYIYRLEICVLQNLAKLGGMVYGCMSCSNCPLLLFWTTGMCTEGSLCTPTSPPPPRFLWGREADVPRLHWSYNVELDCSGDNKPTYTVLIHCHWPS